MTRQIDTLLSGFQEEVIAGEVERARIDAQIARLKRKRDKVPHLGVTDFARRLADALLPLLPEWTAEILGPFGLGSEVGIHFNDESGVTVSSFSIRPEWRDGCRTAGYALIGRDIEVGKLYPPNSVGAANGFNRQMLPLPDVPTLAAYLIEQAAERTQQATA
jgi:hypothetical protein